MVLLQKICFGFLIGYFANDFQKSCGVIIVTFCGVCNNGVAIFISSVFKKPWCAITLIKAAAETFKLNDFLSLAEAKCEKRLPSLEKLRLCLALCHVEENFLCLVKT